MIEIKKLSFSYKENSDKVLNNINLKIRKGEIVLFSGKSGCGKSTLLKTINGIIPKVESGFFEGNIFIDGENLAEYEMYELADKIGSVFQNPKSQFFNLDSDSELAFAMENICYDPDYIRKRIDEVTKLLNIEKIRRRNIFEMSGGEKQILAIASVYTLNPELYVLDEPTANLDYAAIETLKKILLRLKAEGKTVVIAEHRLYYLAEIVDTVYYMSSGIIKKKYSAEEFFSIPDEQRAGLGLRQLHFGALKRENRAFNKMCSLIAENINSAYGDYHVLDSLYFKANRGDIIGITGKNGAGKTTLCRSICGLQKIKKGKYTVDGRLCSEKQRRELSCIIMQDVNHQLFGESVEDECNISLEPNEYYKTEKILKEMELFDFRESHPLSLSGGQKQRLAIAAGMLLNKRIYLFDEPSSGLDFCSMLQVKQQIKKLADSGAIVFIITHDMELLDLLCNRCFFIGNHKLTELFTDENFSEIVIQMLYKASDKTV